MPTDDSNLVRRALRLVDRRAAVHVHKAIPAGGGLGGGSADAAAVLRWAGVDDVAVATALGADVPFCLVGGRARVRGVGEQVEPLPLDRPHLHAGDAARRRVDAGRLPGLGRAGRPDRLDATTSSPRPWSWPPSWPGGATGSASVAGEPPTLAGSGATWFVDGAHPDLGVALPGASVVVTRTDRP